jgi:hypothetical protein
MPGKVKVASKSIGIVVVEDDVEIGQYCGGPGDVRAHSNLPAAPRSIISCKSDITL